ncbi:MAG: hypothetical protein FJX72_02425, partial [Armatimonadetes bacterium]|nr:hypothetical protein [Armatimonadota bacterium]
MPDTSHEPTNTVESPPAAANVTPPPAAANETPPNVAPASRRQQAAAPSLGQSALRYSVLGLGLGIAVGFVPLAQYTCALVLWSDSPNLMRPATPDGQPVPALLSWGATLFRALTAVGGMPLAGALGVYIALVGCAAYAIVRAVNPTFRVTTGVDWDRMLLFRTYMHTAPLIKVVVTAVPAFVVAFGLWMGARLVVPWGEAQAWLAAVVFGATAWVTLSRTGLIGDCDSGNYELPSARRALGMALRGAAFAVVTQIVFLSAAVVAPEALLRMAGAMGGVGEAAWRPVATIWLAASGLGGSVIGVASVVLGRPSTHMVARLRGLVS